MDKIFNKSYKLTHWPTFDNQKEFANKNEETPKLVNNNHPNIPQNNKTNIGMALNNNPRSDYIEKVIQEASYKQTPPVKKEFKVYQNENKPELS